MAITNDNGNTSVDLNALDPDPDKRVWEYDGDGNRIYKENQGFIAKRLYTAIRSSGRHG
ncbi:MAG: hypothetical protein VX941_02385 [Pseudomonadota bacterium]|nr:hypothetical protein [Pseudomonadota bacterium]